MVHRRMMPVAVCALLAAMATAAAGQQKAAAAEQKVAKAQQEAAAAQQEGASEQPPQRKQKTQETEFLRLARDGNKQPSALQAAIVRHAVKDRQKQGPMVDLVAAVHVAEGSYYRQLNREFSKYDAVLYELVAPEGTKIPKGGISGGSPVSMVQSGLTNVLELEFQLEQIDYNTKNMVHADMSPEQFAESMRQRGESVFGIFLRMLGYAIARQNQGSGGSSDAALLLALFDRNRALALKRVLAEQFEEMEGTLVALEGPNGSTILTERNKVVIEVLRKQIAAGKRKIAIFYGAGHMPDLQKRLREQFNLEPVSTRWLVAWNLESDPEPGPKTDPKPVPAAETAQ